MAAEQKLSISVKNTFLDFRPEEEETSMRRSNSWSYAERSWDHQETPDHGYGAMEEMEIVEQMEVVEKVEIVETMGAVEEKADQETQPALSSEAVSQVSTIRDDKPCVYFMSQRGCDRMCGWSHSCQELRMRGKKKRPLKLTRDKYKEQVRRALELEEPERQSELQRLVLHHAYLRKVIMKMLDEVHDTDED
mmetsp:Transcript_60283/g.132039  ORF Transcript_60283/g.132039 Transcript_60283/m.132039 type:complete len:192 (+) Transcript_60283:50-625(+)